MESLTTAISVQVDRKDKEIADGVPFEVVNLRPSKELLASLQEIEDYKNGKVELESYEDVKALRKALIND